MTRKREEIEILRDIAKQAKLLRANNPSSKHWDTADLQLDQLFKELDASGKIDGRVLLAWLDESIDASESQDEKLILAVVSRQVREMMSEAE